MIFMWDVEISASISWTLRPAQGGTPAEIRQKRLSIPLILVARHHYTEHS